MRHFDFLARADRDRLFVRPPEAFTADDDPERVGTGLGAALYCPATRPNLARDIIRRAERGVVTSVVCLEDSVPDAMLEAAERNTVRQLRELAESDAALPMIFVRVRHVRQIRQVITGLGPHAAVLTGFVVPKFAEETGASYLDAVVAASEACGRRLLVMPVLESSDVCYAESRMSTLLAARRLVDKYREYVPAVRIGATDISGAYGLRRAPDFTVWDVRVVADVISAVINVFGRAADGYVVAGPVWEYYSAQERVLKPQLRESPFVAHQERALRAELIAADLDGLIREIVIDRANGLIGKTVIHPSHVAAVHALSVVTQEEYADACDVLATNATGGVAPSSFGNKMNESKPHTAWARRTLLRAEGYGVAREGVSFVDLLGVHQ
ncbi:MAG TPA: HpcH/HpaI aldolase/citrate lyase family protein [Jatrophihabitans sp.]|jgi:citrate lyase beta subunit|nr:HpcH/HpaI aldolase/citrate lyase family protein [Jatrophihabitans sp.]